ncbi:MAG: hypothetical protein OEZ08_06460, partial [Betaproteobacteria bacterium]|nr:hypothetical protein [Betaproteobacteria bacterium]
MAISVSRKRLAAVDPTGANMATTFVHRICASLIALMTMAVLLWPAGGYAQPAFRAASSALNEGMGVQHSSLGNVASGTGATVTPALPARVPGDLLLAIIEASDNNAITMPSPNWTQLVTGTQGNVQRASIFWRIATNTAADTATISHAATPSTRQVLIARVVAFSNVDPANPFDGVSLGSSGGTNATVSTGSITTTNACSVLVSTIHVNDNNSINNAPPGYYQSFYSTTGTGNDAGIGLWYLGATTAGVQPSVSITHSNSGSNDYSHAALFALRPGGLTLNVPPGTQAGDVMVATLATRPANSNPSNQNAKTVCEPPGWTLLRDTTNNLGGGTGGTGVRLQTYYRVATASEPATYTWYAQLNNPSVALATVFVSGVGGMVSYSGVDTASPIDVSGEDTITVKTFSHTGTSITTTVANTMLISSHTFASADSWTPPTGMTERVDQSAPATNNAVGIALEMNEQLRPTAGATGSKTAVASGTGGSNADEGVVHMLALRPVPAPVLPGGFNAFETATAAGDITGVIKTKISGSTVSIDIVALNAARTAVFTSFTGTVRVEILDSGNNSGALDPTTGCRATWTGIQTISPDPAFVSGDNGRKTISFSVPNAYRDARIRVTYPAGSPTVTGCSTDNFAIRPNAFAGFAVSDTNWTTAGTIRPLTDVAFGAVTHKAGRAFSVRAQAMNAAGTPAITTNYTGTPTTTLTACAGAACTPTQGALTLSTMFVAGQLTSDVATYNQVGSFRVQLTDATFAAVDNADSSLAERQIVSGALDVGRFVPDNFAASFNVPSFTTGCGAGNFTYVGQTFGYATQPVITVVARDAANSTTTLYAGAWWRITNASLTGKSYVAASGTLNTGGAPGVDPVIAVAGMGTGTLTFSSGTGFFFNRTTTVPPFDAEVSLAINVIDTDGVALATNPARFSMPSAGNGIAFSAGKQMRFGRLRIGNATGSTQVPLTLMMETQYWLEPVPGKGYFVTNAADGCTAIAAVNVAMGAYRNNLNACETSITVSAFSSGRATARLSAPGAGNNGSVNLTANLGAAGSGSTCIAGAATPVTGANRAYL